MRAVFSAILGMSLTGSLVILAVLALRLGLKRAPKIYSYLLWAVVLLRLLTPFGIPMEVPMPDVRLPGLFGAESGAEALPGYGEQAFDPEERYDRTELFPWYTEDRPVSASSGLPESGGDFAPDPGASLPAASVTAEPEPEEPAIEEPVLGPFGLNSRQTDLILSAAAVIWAVGAVGMIVWNLVSCALLKRRLREAVPAGGNLYETDRVDTAFVFGLFSPRVYLPAGLGQVEKACVAEHERAHIRRLDPLWRLLSFAALSLHWFNPLVWLAFRLSGKDMEMSCDEAVLKRASVDIRAAYSKTLVRFASRGRSAGPVLAFGEGETGSRVKNVMKYKKPVLWVSIAAAAVLVLAGIMLAVNPRAKDESIPFSRYSVEEVLYVWRETALNEKEKISGWNFEIAGDGSFWINDFATAWYSRSDRSEPVGTGKLSKWLREQTGTNVRRISDALLYPYEEASRGWILFSTGKGEFYAASIYGGVDFDSGECRILCRLKINPPSTDDAKLDFLAHSLQDPVGREIEALEFTEQSGSPYTVCTFRAGLDLSQLSVMAQWSEEKIPYTFGLAVFRTEGQSIKRVNWALAEEATFPGWHPSADLLGDAIGPAGGEFTLELPDGRTLFAEVKLPETKRSLFGLKAKETGSGECPIGFRVDGVPNPADESAEEPAENGTEAAPDPGPHLDLDLINPRWESWKLFPYKEGMAEYIRLMPDQAGLTEEKLAAVDSELLMKREDGAYWVFDYLYGDGWTGEDALACLAIGPGELAAVDVFQKSGNTFEGTLTDPDALTALYDAIAQSDVMTRTRWADEIGWSEKSGTEEGYASERILELTGRYGKVARMIFFPHSDLLWLGDSAIALDRGEGEELLGLLEDALGPEDPAPKENTDALPQPSDGMWDKFVGGHYDPNSWMNAAYARRRIDLDRNGRDELVVYRCPAESGYPLDIYEWDPSKGEIRAFSTAVKDVPASLNALPGGTFTAEIGGHDIDKPDGFYGDFFSVNGQTYLISQVSSEFYKKIECYAFSNVRGSLAAAKIFSAERFGEWYYDENRRNTAEINGEAIPYDSFGDALLDWRSSWNNVPGGGDIIIWSEPLWSEEEMSGWPVAWHPPLSEEDGTGEIWTTLDGLFTLMIPAGWEEEIFITPGAWTESGDLWIDFYDRRDYEGENGWGAGLLGSLVLYAHRLDRMYPTNHQELKTVTYPDGRVFDLTLVYPGDIQCSPTNAGHYDYELTRFRKAARTVEFPEGCETSLAPERAALFLADQLKTAYENVFGPFEPLGTDPSPAENEVWLRYAITRLTVSDGRFTGAWEDDEFYWFPVLGNFAVDKKGGGIYRTYEKEGTVSGAIRFVPFDPYDPNAFALLGNTESEAPSDGPPKGQTEDGTLWTSPTGLFSLDLPEGFLDAVEIRTEEQWNGGFADPEYWATFILKDPGDFDGVLGSLVLYPHQLERYYLTGRQEYSSLTFADGGSFEYVLVLPEDPARDHPWYPLGIAAHYLSQLRTAAASAKFPEGTRVTVSPGNAADMLAAELIKAYVNTYGHEPDLSIAEDPSPCPDEEYLCYAINRILTGTLGAKGAWEDENYYWYPVIFPFAVEKETGAIYKVYNGLETVFYPFDPYAPDALGFAG